MSSLRVRSLNVETIGEQVCKLHALNQFGPVRRSVTLDLDLQGPSDPFAGAVFAQAMLVVRPDVNLVVRLPSEQETISSLIRTGVASALTRRREQVHFEPATNPIAEQDLWLNWTPAAREMAAMFGTGEPARGLFGPDHAVFVNPHLTTESEGPASVTRLIERWLTQTVVPGLASERLASAIGVPLFTVDQLVRNVSEHAITPERPTIDSVVGVEVVKLAGRRQLRITVLDTGAGVTATLRPKLDASLVSLPDAKLLHELLCGELPGWGRGRGFGLSAIAGHVLDSRRSSLELWTVGTRVRVGRRVEATAAAGQIAGTVLSVNFSLPTR